MSKFTGGKWEVDVIYGDHYVVFTNDRIVADCNRIVADCFGSNANARLIAAAPEMYEMLEIAQESLRGHRYDSPTAERIEKLLDRIDGYGKEDAEDE